MLNEFSGSQEKKLNLLKYKYKPRLNWTHFNCV